VLKIFQKSRQLNKYYIWNVPIFVGLPKANFEKIGEVRSEVEAEQAY
jgi:hypothetical protein